MKIKGTVARSIKGKFGWGIILQERDGFYFNTKFEPKCDEGDVVGIEAKQTKENAAQIQNLVVLEKGPGPSKSYGGGSGGGGDQRQESIGWESGQKAAAVLIAARQIESAEEQMAQFNATVYALYSDAIDPTNSATFKAEQSVEEGFQGEVQTEGWTEEPQTEAPAAADGWGNSGGWEEF